MSNGARNAWGRGETSYSHKVFVNRYGIKTRFISAANGKFQNPSMKRFTFRPRIIVIINYYWYSAVNVNNQITIKFINELKFHSWLSNKFNTNSFNICIDILFLQKCSHIFGPSKWAYHLLDIDRRFSHHQRLIGDICADIWFNISIKEKRKQPYELKEQTKKIFIGNYGELLTLDDIWTTSVTVGATASVEGSGAIRPVNNKVSRTKTDCL
uniref:Uncharacterized protein n=1 Tax=Glossina pallidipes TaxID=7398 RepID=A0A1A9Z0G0_GLOPL